MDKYDLVILGSGMAAIPAMSKAVELGANVASVIGDTFGGTCLNYGCIPTKALYRVIETINFIENAAKFGINVKGYNASFKGAMDYKDRVISRLKGLRKESVEEWGVKLYEGCGSFISPHEIKVNDEVIYGDKILIATGAKTFIPPIEGAGLAIDSTAALDLKKAPKTVFIIGSGFIGMEFATFFAALGIKVYVAERNPQILFDEDRDMSDVIKDQLEKKGVVFLTKNEAKKIEKKGEKFLVSCDCAQGINEVEVDKVMIATGRVPNVSGLNLDAAGVKFTKNGVGVNEYLQTNVIHIYAAGDVIPGYQLTAVANVEGEAAVVNALKGNTVKMDYSIIPLAIFTDPVLARVGMTENQAKEKGIDAEFMKVPYNLTLTLCSASFIRKMSLTESINRGFYTPIRQVIA